MQTFGQTIVQSFKSTSKKPRWWIFAFLQVLAFVGLGVLSRPKALFGASLFWLPAALLILQPVTLGLWLEIEAEILKVIKNINLKQFISFFIKLLIISLFAVVISSLARFIYSNWVFNSIFSSVVASTSALASLYVVLCGQNIGSAVLLAFDTWHKKVSLALMATVALVISHSIGFVFAHQFFREILGWGEFSGIQHSATIWLLLIPLGVILGFIAAFLNHFLVNIFLQIINQKKVSEPVEGRVTMTPNPQGLN